MTEMGVKENGMISDHQLLCQVIMHITFFSQ